MTRAGKRRSRWVVKAGSNLIVSGGPRLVRAWMRQVAQLRARGVEVIWVTSGAIASATERTRAVAGVPAGRARGLKRTLPEKQALSAIGQPIIMDLYNLSLQAAGRRGAQVLLTYDDLASAPRRRNFQNTLAKLLDWDVTPVLNENDAVATEEIRFGDNDSLSSKVAAAMRADRLVILTDVDGLYDRDPRAHRGARLIPSLPRVTPKLLAGTDPGAGSARGTGGMYSKLSAARAANARGIETWLARGDRPGVLLEIARGRAIGTRIGGRP
jgi:glutamate 5-kinase